MRGRLRIYLGVIVASFTVVGCIAGSLHDPRRGSGGQGGGAGDASAGGFPGTGGGGSPDSGGNAGTGASDSGACTSPLQECNGKCVYLQSDDANCGSCGNACGAGSSCQGGKCTCPGGGLYCSSGCIDPATDNANCGGCGTACSGGTACSSGHCQCPTGSTSCNGQCVDTQTDGQNCGGCGTACSSGQTCSGGKCSTTCSKTRCGASCVDTQTDNANCGACGKACTGGTSCQAGSCACPTGQKLYGGACCTPKTSCASGQCNSISDGCGGTLDCGNCPYGQTCSNSVCCTKKTCSPGQCGAMADGCGGTLTCATCPAGSSCSSNNVCVCAPHSGASTPHSPSTVINDSSIGSYAWANPGYAKTSDNQRATSSVTTNTSTNYLRATGFGFNIPATAKINGIEVKIERSGTGSATDNKIKLYKPSNNSYSNSKSGSWPLVESVVTIGSSTALWGKSWTPADINNPAFGVEMAGWCLALSGSCTATFSVDSVTIVVFYTYTC